jgi:hypothetical protein
MIYLIQRPLQKLKNNWIGLNGTRLLIPNLTLSFLARYLDLLLLFPQIPTGLTQIPGSDYDLTYSPVMDSTTYRYLIAFALHHCLLMHQLNIVTAYLYGPLDKTIYTEAPPELIIRMQYNNQRIKEIKTIAAGPIGHIQPVLQTKPTIKTQKITAWTPIDPEARAVRT